jgi:predicted nucleic acid-binding protein
MMTRRAAGWRAAASDPPVIRAPRQARGCDRVAADLDSAGTPAKHRLQDLWIAALALELGMKVLTRDEKDFDDVPGLDLISI